MPPVTQSISAAPMSERCCDELAGDLGIALAAGAAGALRVSLQPGKGRGGSCSG